MDKFWQEQVAEKDKALAKAQFTIGWLTGTMKSHGISNEEIELEKQRAKAKADEIFG